MPLRGKMKNRQNGGSLPLKRASDRGCPDSSALARAAPRDEILFFATGRAYGLRSSPARASRWRASRALDIDLRAASARISRSSPYRRGFPSTVLRSVRCIFSGSFRHAAPPAPCSRRARRGRVPVFRRPSAHARAARRGRRERRALADSSGNARAVERGLPARRGRALSRLPSTFAEPCGAERRGPIAFGGISRRFPREPSSHLPRIPLSCACRSGSVGGLRHFWSRAFGA